MNTLARLKRWKSSAGRIAYRSFLPYTSVPVIPDNATISDQFLYRGDITANRFVAENTLALLCGEPLEAQHRLSFFDANGQPFHDLEVTSSRYFEPIHIGDLGVPFASFVHGTTYDPDDIARSDPERLELLRLRRWHRGYCLYQKTSHSVFSAVHGNFGGITMIGGSGTARHQFLARRRATFLYTPQHRFADGQTITLFFMNSCRTAETVALLSADNGAGRQAAHLGAVKLAPLGTERYVLESFSGYLTLRSKLPMCRPLVFVDTTANPNHFDVFHT